MLPSGFDQVVYASEDISSDVVLKSNGIIELDLSAFLELRFGLVLEAWGLEHRLRIYGLRLTGLDYSSVWLKS